MRTFANCPSQLHLLSKPTSSATWACLPKDMETKQRRQKASPGLIGSLSCFFWEPATFCCKAQFAEPGYVQQHTPPRSQLSGYCVGHWLPTLCQSKAKAVPNTNNKSETWPKKQTAITRTVTIWHCEEKSSGVGPADVCSCNWLDLLWPPAPVGTRIWSLHPDSALALPMLQVVSFAIQLTAASPICSLRMEVTQELK